MKVEVRQQWADVSILNGSYFSLYSLALFQHARLKPLLDQAQDAPVCHAVLDKLHQPSVIESVIKTPDVGIEHPLHFPRSVPERQRVQCLVWTGPRSESIREPEKVLFVDRVQHLDRGTLDDLIFQRRNPEWTKRGLPTSGCSPYAQVSLGTLPLHPMGEILEVCLEVLPVVLPRLAVHACSRVPLNRKVRYPQPLNVRDVVKQRTVHP